VYGPIISQSKQVSTINNITGLSAYNSTFVIADWLSSGDQYYIDFTHNKNTYAPELALYEGVEEVIPFKTEVISANLVRVYICGVPDDRFDGLIKVI
jgi:hypothetical protein